MDKGILVRVYRTGGGDATNNGSSKKFDNLVIDYDKTEQPNIPLDSVTEEETLVVKLRVYRGITYYRLVPKHLRNTHTSFGGNFAYTSDSRFPFTYPLPIHDRVENGK